MKIQLLSSLCFTLLSAAVSAKSGATLSKEPSTAIASEPVKSAKSANGVLHTGSDDVADLNEDKAVTGSKDDNLVASDGVNGRGGRSRTGTAYRAGRATSDVDRGDVRRARGRARRTVRSAVRNFDSSSIDSGDVRRARGRVRRSGRRVVRNFDSSSDDIDNGDIRRARGRARRTVRSAVRNFDSSSSIDNGDIRRARGRVRRSGRRAVRNFDSSSYDNGNGRRGRDDEGYGACWPDCTSRDDVEEDLYENEALTDSEDENLVESDGVNGRGRRSRTRTAYRAGRATSDYDRDDIRRGRGRVRRGRSRARNAYQIGSATSSWDGSDVRRARGRVRGVVRRSARRSIRRNGRSFTSSSLDNGDIRRARGRVRRSGRRAVRKGVYRAGRRNGGRDDDIWSQDQEEDAVIVSAS